MKNRILRAVTQRNPILKQTKQNNKTPEFCEYDVPQDPKSQELMTV